MLVEPSRLVCRRPVIRACLTELSRRHRCLRLFKNSNGERERERWYLEKSLSGGWSAFFPSSSFFFFSRSFHVLPYLSRSEISPSSASSASQRGDKSASGAPRASIFFSLRNVPSPRERDRVPGFVGQFLLPWNFLSGIPVCTLYTRSGRR